MAKTQRSGGLDLLRVLAVALVFMDHYPFYHEHSLFGVWGQDGWVGVELFFVLSGFLIGRQVWLALQRNQFSFGNFYYRRALRTLPAYWVVLAIYFLVPASREAPLSTPLWQFLTFTQNFFATGDAMYGAYMHSWSLCVEEHFYVFFPLVALWLFYKKSVRTAWRLFLVIMLGEIVLRAVIWLLTMGHVTVEAMYYSYGHWLYYPTYTRLGGLTVGVALSWVTVFQPALWQRWLAFGNAWLVAGLVGCAVFFYCFWSEPSVIAYVPNVFAYPLVELSFACLVIAVQSPGCVLNVLHSPVIGRLAVWSYSIYLTQRIAIHVSNTWLLKTWHTSSSSEIAIALAAITNILMGLLLYYLVENPFLRLREKVPLFAGT
jgi:peptidoglycan/LPS O-acetylase OafA/YrhL